MLPMPPGHLAAANPARTRRPNPDRAKELVEIGDRSFRGGNIRRAEERYFLAAKADPTAPLPFVHLAQVSLVRKDYATAAERIRSAVTAAQGAAWLANAPDIQAMFAEPGDFARHMARLESHLQTNPSDRDAWFVLGVEWYLSGRTQQAADAFHRLTDRRPDEALAAFLDAAKLLRPAAN
jgi:Tfp pilus assembly protein PilF